MSERVFVQEPQGVFPRAEVGLVQVLRAAVRVRTDHRYRVMAGWMAVTDAASFAGAVYLASLLRFGTAPLPESVVVTLLVVPLLAVGMFWTFGLYQISRLSPAEELRRVIGAIALATTLRIAVSAVFTSRGYVVQKWAGLTLLFSFAFVLASRFAWHKYMGRLRRAGTLAYRVLILGTNQEAVRIAEALGTEASGFLPIGMIEPDGGPPSDPPLPVLGGIEDLSKVIQQEGVECVFVASSAINPEVTKRIVRRLRHHQVEVRFSANLMEIMASRLTVNPVGNLLALSLRPVRLTRSKAMAKRTFDLTMGAVVLAATTPIWLVSAFATKLTSRGPVLFRQERAGRDARLFTMYKFRTMLDGAESMLPDVAGRNMASGPLFKIEHDPRITPFGRFLRRFSLDELPQLLNVLKGEMSLVGPRPPLPSEVAAYEDWHHDRLEVRPGITGLWQVGRRPDWSFDDYVRLDLFYIENWSVTYDLFILAKTLPAVIRSHNF